MLFRAWWDLGFSGLVKLVHSPCPSAHLALCSCNKPVTHLHTQCSCLWQQHVTAVHLLLLSRHCPTGSQPTRHRPLQQTQAARGCSSSHAHIAWTKLQRQAMCPHMVGGRDGRSPPPACVAWRPRQQQQQQQQHRPRPNKPATSKQAARPCGTAAEHLCSNSCNHLLPEIKKPDTGPGPVELQQQHPSEGGALATAATCSHAQPQLAIKHTVC
jgi:hypothetical protein